MPIASFEELNALCLRQQKEHTLAVVCADSEHTLDAAVAAWKAKLARPVLIGSESGIRRKLAAMQFEEELPIIDINEPERAVMQAIELVRNGEADAIFKGMLETATLMRAIVRKENGMVIPGRVMSHVTMLEIPGYHKLVGVTDGALLTYPSLEQKKALIENAVEYLRGIGCEEPKVAVLAAVEKLNPKMPATVDADALRQMNESGELAGCLLAGPISYDIAMKPGAAAEKGYSHPVAGDPDLLVVPNIDVGNVLLKSLTCSARAKGAGLVLGARVPVILTSRSTGTAGKLRSIALASAL